MRFVLPLLLSLALALLSTPATAQRNIGGSGGTLAAGWQYDLLTEHIGPGGSQTRTAAVIVWRTGPAPLWPLVIDTAAVNARQRSCNAERDAARDVGRSYVGSCGKSVQYDRDGRVWVLGRQFDLPTRDSALVIVVAPADSTRGSPVIEVTAMVSDGPLYPIVEQPSQRGDTTMFVIPRDPFSEIMDRLRESAAVATLLPSADSREVAARAQISASMRSGSGPPLVGSGGGNLELGPTVVANYSTSLLVLPGATPHVRLDFVILWRGQPGWHTRLSPTGGDTAAANSAAQLYREAQRAAEDRNWVPFGRQSGALWYLASRNREGTRLSVLDRDFDIPRRDSTIVVMIDRIDNVGGPPIIAGVAYVSDRLPDDFPSRHWQRADTSFSVGGRNQLQTLDSILRQSITVRDFLR